MKSYRLWGSIFLAPALALVLVGCGGDKGVDQPKGSGGKSGEAGTTKPTTTGEMSALEGKPTATIKGKVTYDGTPPAPKDFKNEKTFQDNGNKDYCMKGDTMDPTWKVSKDGGVANVVVFLRAPQGKFFKVPEDQQKRSDEVAIDQPHCLFIPHVVALYPTYWDGKEQKPTGQKFVIKNSAEIPHNTSYSGNTLINPSQNLSVKAKEQLDAKVKASTSTKPGGEDLLNINCDIHKWMTAKAVAFDHPYVAVTKEDGSYEIKGAPAGAEVDVAVWHETFGNSLKDAKTEKLTLKDGDNSKDFKVKAK